MSIVLSDTKPKARKDHRCSCCLGVIRKGVTYTRTTCIYDGRVYDWLSCPGCDDISNAVFDYVSDYDEGVTADDYDDWAREHQNDTVCGQGARAYLARRAEGTRPTVLSPTDHTNGDRAFTCGLHISCARCSYSTCANPEHDEYCGGETDPHASMDAHRAIAHLPVPSLTPEGDTP